MVEVTSIYTNPVFILLTM